MLDTSAIGDVIASSILDLEETYPEGRVRSVVLVVEVDDGRPVTKWEVYGDDRPWVRRTVLEMGLGQLDVEAFETEPHADED
jgi:hypothetical protein